MLFSQELLKALLKAFLVRDHPRDLLPNTLRQLLSLLLRVHGDRPNQRELF